MKEKEKRLGHWTMVAHDSVKEYNVTKFSLNYLMKDVWPNLVLQKCTERRDHGIYKRKRVTNFGSRVL